MIFEFYGKGCERGNVIVQHTLSRINPYYTTVSCNYVIDQIEVVKESYMRYVLPCFYLYIHTHHILRVCQTNDNYWYALDWALHEYLSSFWGRWQHSRLHFMEERCWHVRSLAFPRQLAPAKTILFEIPDMCQVRYGLHWTDCNKSTITYLLKPMVLSNNNA